MSTWVLSSGLGVIKVYSASLWTYSEACANAALMSDDKCETLYLDHFDIQGDPTGSGALVFTPSIFTKRG